MDQQAYLQRLRSIREKYGCRDVPNYNKPIVEAPYPKTDLHNPEYTLRSFQDRVSNRPILQLQDRERNSLLRQYQQQVKQPRSYSVYENRVKSSSLQKCQFNEAQIKRQQNFTQFIKDLDVRIEQKEKILAQRFKENEAIIKKTQSYNQLDTRNMQRYNSQRDLRTIPHLQEKVEYVVPRSSYQKSSLYLNKRTNPYENRQNEASIKIQASPARKKFGQMNNIIRQNENTLLTSPSLIQKKLQKNLVINRQSWNPGKLQNIQQRIKSVLKQCNN